MRCEFSPFTSCSTKSLPCQFRVIAKSCEKGHLITTSQLDHSRQCSGAGRQRAVSFAVMAAPVASMLASTSSVKASRALLKREVGIDPSPAAAWRHFGNDLQSQLLQEIYEFALVPAYVQNAQETDKGGRYICEKEATAYASDSFCLVYCTTSASKASWTHHHRRMVFVDGGFLSGTWREQFLSLVTKDANERLQRLCFMVCHAESKTFYKRFLELAEEDFPGVLKCLVMSDGSVGAEAACTELNIEQVLCTFHGKPLLVKATKIKLTEPVNQVLGLLFKCCNEKDFNVHLTDLKLFPHGEKAAAWIQARNDKYCSYAIAQRGFFNFQDVTNNNAEQSQGSAKEERENRMLSLLDRHLQRMVQQKLSDQALVRGSDVNFESGLAPAAKDRLQAMKKQAMHCAVLITAFSLQHLVARVKRSRLRIASTLESFYTEPIFYNVNLRWDVEKSVWVVICDCGEPQVTGSICVDAVAAIAALPKLSPFTSLPRDAKQALLALFNADHVRWHHKHFHAATWLAQHDGAHAGALVTPLTPTMEAAATSEVAREKVMVEQVLPTFAWKSENATADDVSALLNNDGYLPLAPPPGRAMLGRKPKNELKRRVKRLKSQFEKARTHGTPANGNDEEAESEQDEGNDEENDEGNDVDEVEEEEDERNVDEEDKDHCDMNLSEAPIYTTNDDSDAEWVTFEKEKRAQEKQGEELKHSEHTSTPCALCGSKEHTTTRCRNPDTFYILMSNVPNWKSRHGDDRAVLDAAKVERKTRNRSNDRPELRTLSVIRQSSIAQPPSPLQRSLATAATTAPEMRLETDQSMCSICGNHLRPSQTKTACTMCDARAHHDCILTSQSETTRKRRQWTCKRCLVE